MLARSSGEDQDGFQQAQTLVLAPLVLGQGSVTSRDSCPVLPKRKRTPFPVPSYLLVSQQELQVTLSPVWVRLRPRLQLVPLVIPAVQVLQAQRQG